MSDIDDLYLEVQVRLETTKVLSVLVEATEIAQVQTDLEATTIVLHDLPA